MLPLKGNRPCLTLKWLPGRRKERISWKINVVFKRGRFLACWSFSLKVFFNFAKRTFIQKIFQARDFSTLKSNLMVLKHLSCSVGSYADANSVKEFLPVFNTGSTHSGKQLLNEDNYVLKPWASLCYVKNLVPKVKTCIMMETLENNQADRTNFLPYAGRHLRRSMLNVCGNCNPAWWVGFLISCQLKVTTNCLA